VKEIEKFTGKRATVWESSNKHGRIDARYHIINYDIIEKNIKALNAAGFDLLVCDEATKIKNRKTKRAKAILGDGKHKKEFPGLKTKHVLFLTGTPVLNRPIEAFTLLNFLDKERFNNFYHFIQKYGGWKGEPPRNLDELHERTKELVIRRLKSEVLKDLPPKQRNQLYVELSPSELKEYNEHLKTLFRKWRSLGKPSVAEMPAIQQFIIEKKLPRLYEIIDEYLEQDRPLLIYCCYINPLKQILEKYKDDAVILYGDMNPKDRQVTIDSLSAGKKKIGLFSINAGSMGIDGLQHSMDTVIFLDRWWVPAIHDQAEDRLFRNGQTKQVQSFYMTCEHTIDDYMANLLSEKQLMIDKIVDGKQINFDPQKSFFKEFVRSVKRDYMSQMDKINTDIVIDV
jgi:SNF2 family DNA or RNA helicase